MTNEEYARQLSLVTDIRELKQQIRDLDFETLDAIRNSSSASAELSNAVNARIRDNELLVAGLERQAEAAQRRLEADRGTTNEASSQTAVLQANLEIEEARLGTSSANTAALRSATEELEKHNKSLEEYKNKSDEISGKWKEIQSTMGGVAEGLFEMGSGGENLLGSLSDVGSSLADIAGDKISGALGPKMAQGLGGVASIAFEAGKAMLDLAIEVGNTSNQIQQITGVSAEFANNLAGSFADVRGVGASLEDITGAAADLSKVFTDFTMSSAQVTRTLVEQSVTLGKLGVATSDFAAGTQLAVKSLGATAEQAGAIQLELAAFAMDIGVAPQQMASDFAEAGGSLAKFGSDGVQVFKDLSVAAKITGVSISRLLDITKEFDTFEGAATAAGKLNAALGGNFVNAMELLTETDPATRFNMMRDAMLDAGKSFDTMTYFERKFFAESMGLQDVAELAKVMSGNMDDLTGNIGKTSAEYEAMAERANTVQSFQEQLNNLFADMVPLIEPLVGGLQTMVSVMRENKELVHTLAVGFAVFGASIALATAPITATGLAIAAITAAVVGLGYWMFQYQWSSNFGEGWRLFGNSIGYAGEMMGVATNEMDSLKGSVSGFDGKTFKSKHIQSFESEGANGIALAARAAPVHAQQKIVTQAMSGGGSSGSNSGGKQVIELKLDRKVLSRVVTEDMSKFSRKQIQK